MLQQDIQITALVNAAVHFMLAAGDGEDEIRLLLDGVVQSKIRGHIAGMQCHDHVDLPVGEHIFGHIRMDKFQTGVAVFLRDLPAALHHIRLQIIADDGGLDAPFDREVIVEDKGQVAFAAAEIQNGDGILAVIPESMIDQLNEPVDLLVLIVLGPDDFKIGGKHTQVNQSGDVFSLFQDIFLLPVVALDLAGQRHGGGGMAFIAAVTLHGVLDGLGVGDHQGLPIAAFQLGFHKFQKFPAGNIPVKGLVIPKGFQLIAKLSFQHHRADADFLVSGLIDGLAEYGLGKAWQRSFKIGQ